MSASANSGEGAEDTDTPLVSCQGLNGVGERERADLQRPQNTNNVQHVRLCTPMNE